MTIDVHLRKCRKEIEITLRECKSRRLGGQVFFKEQRAVESKSGNPRRRMVFIHVVSAACVNTTQEARQSSFMSGNR